MSESLEAILLRLGLDASGFTKGARDAKKELGSLEKGVGSLKGEMAALATQAAAGFGVAVLVKEALEFAGAVTKVHEQTGLSIQSIQFLRLAADQTGSSVDGLAGMVNKLQRQLVAAGENDKLRAQIEDLVGPLTELRQLKPEEQLQKVAEAIAGISDPADRTAAAITLLGKSGADAIPQMEALAKHQDELNAAFARTGGAVSADAIAKVEGLGDAAGEVKTSVVALATELLSTVAPAFTSFLQTVTEVVGGLRLLDGQGSNATVNLDTNIRNLQDRLSSFKANNPFPDDWGKEQIATMEKQLKLLQDQFDWNEYLGEAGARRYRIEREGALAAKQLGEEAAANLTANLSDEAATLKHFAGMKLEEQAAELDAETLQRIEKLRELHEAERVEKEAQAQFDKDLADQTNAYLKDGAERAADANIGTKQFEVSSIAGILQQQTEGIARHSKAAFEVNKAAGIANAVINTAQGVTQNLANPGLPWAIPLIAATVAAGAAQISAIASTSFGSKSAPSQAPTPAMPTAPVGGGGGGGGGSDRVMNIKGITADSLLTGRMVQQMVAGINEFVKDGGRLITSND